MKKLLALTLALLLCLGAVSALASEYTLDEKLQMQLRDGSGLKLLADFQVSQGARMTALDQATNLVLNALLPIAKLDARYIRGAGTLKGQEDLSLALLRGETQLADLRFTTDGTLESLRSQLLGTQPLASLKGDGLILSLFAGGDARWPGLERALLAMNGADNEWRSRAEAAFKPYLDKTSLWLQGFGQTSTVQEDGRTLTQTLSTIPVANLKQQMKALLTDLYNDAAMLTLLRQQFSAREAAAYLEPSMLPGFNAAIDALPLAGNLVLRRAYDTQGNVAVDELSLPMGGARGLDLVVYQYKLDAQAQRHLNVELHKTKVATSAASGELVVLSMQGAPLATQQEGMESGAYTGTVTITPEVQSFTVGTNPAATGTPAQPTVKTMAFTLNFQVDKEVLDTTAQQSTRAFQAQLELAPTGFAGLGAQRIAITGQFRGGVNSRAATYVSAQAVWTDLSTQGSITMNLTGNSAAPWAIPTVAASNAIRLDSLSAEQLVQQKNNIALALRSSLAALTASLLQATPAP